MVLVVFLLYFTIQKLQAVKRLTSGDLPRRSPAAGKKKQKGRQSFEQRLEASPRQRNAVVWGKTPTSIYCTGVSGNYSTVLNILW